MQGLREGGHSWSSSSSGLTSHLDKLDGSSALSSSPQVRRGGSSALASSLGLSSKVTFHLNCMELGDWAHLLDDSLGMLLPGDFDLMAPSQGSSPTAAQTPVAA